MVTKLENMLKLITIICLVMLLLNSCIGKSKEKAFVVKYDIEDFSQFNNVHIFIRSGDRERSVIMVNAPFLVHDTARVGLYVVIFDNKNYQILDTKWSLTKDYVNADTVKLQQLAQTFMQYKIPRLNVDEQGNVFVYLADIETLALVRFVNESELLKNPNRKWENSKGNWYKPK
jgi:hypothetical protein